jgi:hypothetical protein
MNRIITKLNIELEGFLQERNIINSLILEIRKEIKQEEKRAEKKQQRLEHS